MRPLLALLLLIPLCLQAQEANDDAAMLVKFRQELEAYTEALAKTPDSAPLLSWRGDRYLFLGEFPKAVADFEKMIALDPSTDAPHWRLGIAYYFAGDFANSARQFEKYHAYDGGDRENGIWKFLAEARSAGIEKARAGMLSYTRFDREPFPALYEMFAGKKSTEEVFVEIRSKKLEQDERVMFFANYYAGLNEDLLGHRDKARELLRRAVASPSERKSEGGPAYMWQVARLHTARLEQAAR